MNVFSAPPVEGPITGAFGATSPPWAPGRPHRGTDFGVVTGTFVHYMGHKPAAVAALEHDDVPGFGRCVRLSLPVPWPGLHGIYAHLATVVWRDVGEVVKPGEILGRSGSTGGPWAAHLHWEINEDLYSTPDISRARDGMAMIGDPPVAKIPEKSLQSSQLNDLYVMRRDIIRTLSAPWSEWGLPEMHKELRDAGALDRPEYTGDYSGMLNP